MSPHDDVFERKIGRPAKSRAKTSITRVRIGDTVWTGTRIEVTRYADYAGRRIVEITLVDGIAL